jgi:dTDP-4-dehydrorhamnose reductase
MMPEKLPKIRCFALRRECRQWLDSHQSELYHACILLCGPANTDRLRFPGGSEPHEKLGPGELRVHILLTGGSGLLGTELRKLGAEFDAPGHDQLDVRDAVNVREYIDSQRPAIIIHAAAATNNREIEADPRTALETNIIGTTNVALACLGTRIRLVYISTDYVYRGDRGEYTEADELLPANLYAWTKLAGECAVRAVPNHLIIRTSFGGTRFDYPAAFTDKWSSKDYVDVIAPQLLQAARSPLTGIVNIGGPRRTIYDYASERSPEVRKITRDSSQHASPADTSMQLDRWQEYKRGQGVVRGVTSCRVCGSERMQRYLDLGMLPLANNLAASALAARQMPRFPMQVQYCRDCSLSQLSVVVDPRELFSHYTYRSSINKGYIRHCRQMAIALRDSLELTESDLVVDIAGNDGALLAEFRDEIGVGVLNVDPAENIAAIAESRGIPTINHFWSDKVAERVVREFGRPKLITATNVFAHVDDVRGFMAAAKTSLHPQGALVLEFPYGVDFIEHCEFDTIYFEHLSYMLIEPVRRLASSLDMAVFDVQKQDIHGGTVRVFVGHDGAHSVRPSVQSFLDNERRGGYHDVALYLDWRREIDALIDDTVEQLRRLKRGGAKIAAFAASAKGNTLLNACRLDTATIDYIVDDTPEKIGKFSPGTGIPIVDRSRLAADPPDCLVILAWNFKQEIIDSMPEYSQGGGRYIIPIPGFQIVEGVSKSHD